MRSRTSTTQNAGRSNLIRRSLIWVPRVLILVAFQATILLLSAGQFSWAMAWVYIGVFAASILFMAVYLELTNPKLIEERSEVKPRANVQKWDLVLSSLVRVMLLLTLLICGLDQRFGWTKGMPLGVQVLALLVGFCGYVLIMWALASNQFAAVYTRIQDERGHTVTTTGPYRFVRHPFYVGVITYALVIPLALGSLWALIPGGFVALLFVIKTALEDRLLLGELDGYREYSELVRYRLLPGVW